MRKENWTQEQYAALLREELRPALGCTEPVSIALCAAAMTKALGCMPERILVQCSRNILKNAKGVVVPNSGGMKGIDVAAALGAIVGAPERGLEVLTGVTPEQIEAARAWLARGACQVRLMDTPETLHLVVTGISGDGHTASAELKRTHTGLTRVTRDNVAIFHCKTDAEAQEENNAAKSLNVGGILTFAEKARLEENGLRELLERQIECNSRIAEEGLSHPYGACVGATLLRHFGESASVRAQAYAAAGSDARMGGCEMPVVINSGSGNQGLTVTLPVLEYARELGKDHETVLRALLVSNLVAIRIKAAYGRLSAFCGAVSAAAGSGAAITWLRGGTETQIETTIVNTLADISGMVCDGAKASCASKIASAVGTAILASCMSMDSKGFAAGEGLVKQNVEQTIDTIGRMASEGMAETDKKILQLMQEA
jgi:L-cysteine desulfidase